MEARNRIESGEGSLRQAIEDANATPEANTITFAPRIWENDSITDDDAFATGAEADLGAFELEQGSEFDPFTVTTTEDVVDASDGVVSLREAISSANANPDANTILFSDALAGATLSLSQGPLVISTDLTVDGTFELGDDQQITLEGIASRNLFQLIEEEIEFSLNNVKITRSSIYFNIGQDYTNAAIYAISGTIVNVNNSDFPGYSEEDSGQAVFGDTINIFNSNIRGHRSDGIDAAAAGIVGRTVTVENSFFSRNNGANADAGAISADSLYINNSQFTLNGGGFSGSLIGDNIEVKNTSFNGNSPPAVGDPVAGAIFSRETLHVTDSTFKNHRAVSTIRGDYVYFNGVELTDNRSRTIYGGGSSGPLSTNRLVILNSLVANNDSIGGEDFSIFGDSKGGGLSVREDLFISNTTVYGNYLFAIAGSAPPPSGGPADSLGGGVFVGGNAEIVNSSITNNEAVAKGGAGGAGVAEGGGLFVEGELVLTNTIVANNTGGDEVVLGENGSLVLQGTNLVQDGSVTGPNVLNEDPLLGPLQDNGGPTETLALLKGSPAIDAADTDLAPDTDQRGIDRPQGAEADLGAFELEASEFDLVLLGSDGVADELIGEDGNDFLKGFGAVDFYDGGDGTDTLDLSTTNRDAVIDLAGGTIVFLNFADETALNIENVVGTLGDNRIIGTDGDNEIDGEAGTDTVVYQGARGDYTVTEDEGVITVAGPEGTDTLTNVEFLEFLGDPPSNRILIGEETVADALFGGDGNDFLRGLSGLDYHDGGAGEDTVDISHTGVAVVADLDAGTLVFANGLTETALNIENLIATQGSDRIAGTAGDNVIDGQGGDDTVLYALAADQYDVGGPSGTGAFTVTGPDGTDTLTGIEFLNFADTGDIAVGDLLVP